MNKQLRVKLIQEAKSAFKAYQDTTTDKKKDQADDRVVQYAVEAINAIPGNLMRPDIAVLSNGTMVLTWTKQSDIAFDAACLYLYDSGRMHLCMNCGEFAGQIFASNVNDMKGTMKAFVERLKPFFS